MTVYVGKQDVGASSASLYPGYLDGSGPFACTTDGTCTTGRLYLSSPTANTAMRLVVYEDDSGLPGALVAASAEVQVASGAAAGWHDFTFGEFSVTNGTSYWLIVWAADGNADYAYDTGPSDSERYRAEAYSSTGSPPDPMSSTGSGTQLWSAYLVVNEAGSSSRIPAAGHHHKGCVRIPTRAVGLIARRQSQPRRLLQHA